MQKYSIPINCWTNPALSYPFPFRFSEQKAYSMIQYNKLKYLQSGNQAANI